MRGNVFSVYQHSNALADVDRSAETQHIDYHNDICPNREGVNGARPHSNRIRTTCHLMYAASRNAFRLNRTRRPLPT